MKMRHEVKSVKVTVIRIQPNHLDSIRTDNFSHLSKHISINDAKPNHLAMLSARQCVRVCHKPYEPTLQGGIRLRFAEGTLPVYGGSETQLTFFTTSRLVYCKEIRGGASL